MTELVSMQELVDEHDASGIGPLIYDEIVKACWRTAAPRYPPQPYARRPTWDEDAIVDLAQDVATNDLIADRQLLPLLNSATLREFRRRLDARVRRTLAKRRSRTVIDNLLDRALERLAAEPYVAAGTRGRLPAFTLPGRTPREGDPTDGEVREAAIACRVVPTARPTAVEKAPIVYTGANFDRVVEIIVSSLPTTVTRRDLDRVFNEFLTPWTPGRLVPYEAEAWQPRLSELSVDEEQAVNDAVTLVEQALSETEKDLLRRVARGEKDRDTAAAYGKSRQTIISWRSTAVARAYARLRDLLDDGLGDAAVRRLYDRLVVGTENS